mmetsp:Transcript_948/g.2203  ORF Transcript_948/g.2203 Transcript_948/m.2203 type:complete len:203 (+) Transcript_948:717-1325(+)
MPGTMSMRKAGSVERGRFTLRRNAALVPICLVKVLRLRLNLRPPCISRFCLSNSWSLWLRRSRMVMSSFLFNSSSKRLGSPRTPLTSTIVSPSVTFRTWLLEFHVSMSPLFAPETMSPLPRITVSKPWCSPVCPRCTLNCGTSNRLLPDRADSSWSASCNKASSMSFNRTRFRSRVSFARLIMFWTCLKRESAFSAAPFTVA